MPLPVKQDEAPNPGDICLFGKPTVVTNPDRLAHAVEQLRGRTHVDDDGIVVSLPATTGDAPLPRPVLLVSESPAITK